jgi:hypothetical protein
LRQHKGTQAGGGNHRGSIFRLLVGEALINRGNLAVPTTWGLGSSAERNVRVEEAGHEVRVSTYIRQLPFLVLKVDDKEDRKFLEYCLISLLSNINRGGTDPDCSDVPSDDWLGRHSDRPRVVDSGLWNNHYANTPYCKECASRCLSLFRDYINAM